MTIEERWSISKNLKGICKRIEEINSAYPNCMFLVTDFLDRGDTKLAIEYLFQALSTPEDKIIDIRLHDLVYVIYASRILGVAQYNLGDFQFLEAEVISLYD